MIRALSLATLLAVAPAWAADAPAKPAKAMLAFPRIASAGGVIALPGRVDMPAPDAVHRLLVDATGAETTASGTNMELQAAGYGLIP